MRKESRFTASGGRKSNGWVETERGVDGRKSSTGKGEEPNGNERSTPAVRAGVPDKDAAETPPSTPITALALSALVLIIMHSVHGALTATPSGVRPADLRHCCRRCVPSSCGGGGGGIDSGMHDGGYRVTSAARSHNEWHDRSCV